MAWDDPAPARGARSAHRRSPSQSAPPGYGPPSRLPFAAILGRGLGAVVIGGMGYGAAHWAVAAWQVAHHAAASIAWERGIALAVGVVVGALALRYLLGRPHLWGLPLRVRDGGSGWGRRRGWDDVAYPSFGEQVAANIAVDVVGAAIDALVD